MIDAAAMSRVTAKVNMYASVRLCRMGKKTLLGIISFQLSVVSFQFSVPVVGGGGVGMRVEVIIAQFSALTMLYLCSLPYT
jgi:hypothetical protein